MAYNPPVINSDPIADFGNLPNSSGTKMTGFVSSNPQTIDGTASPQTSPLTVNTTSTLVVPPKALSCVLSSPTTFQVSEDSTQTAFFNVPANVIFTVDCFRITNLYLKVASSQLVSFYFKMLN